MCQACGGTCGSPARRRVSDTATISARMETTPEGYLLCRDVALARTGEQTYYAHELPGVPARHGYITAIRDEAEVFAPSAIASFAGKAFTDDHPDRDVTAENWRTFAKGVVMNPRRGSGSLADKLIGDIMVYDPATIAKIRAGKREISNGYDAEYEVIEPGRARQINIRGNHVSLVDEGRCGPSCAIRDRKILMSKRPTWKDHLLRAFRSTDEAEREEALRAAEADDTVHEGDGHHITVNVAAPPSETDADKEPAITTPKPTEDEEGEPEKDTAMDEDKVREICTAAISEAMAPVMERLDAIVNATVQQQEQVAEIAEAVDEMSDPEDMATQDAVARAAILAPNLARPTTDAKPGSKPHRDAMSGFKRDALRAALTTTDGAAAVQAVLGHAQPHRIATLSPAEVNLAFRAASQSMLDRNAARTVDTLTSATSGYVRDDKGQRTRPMTTADLQAKANAYFGRR